MEDIRVEGKEEVEHSFILQEFNKRDRFQSWTNILFSFILIHFVYKYIFVF